MSLPIFLLDLEHHRAAWARSNSDWPSSAGTGEDPWLRLTYRKVLGKGGYKTVYLVSLGEGMEERALSVERIKSHSAAALAANQLSLVDLLQVPGTACLPAR